MSLWPTLTAIITGVTMGIKSGIFNLIKSSLDKRVCTVEEFTKACDVAKAKTLQDRDGFITWREGIKIMVQTLKSLR